MIKSIDNNKVKIRHLLGIQENLDDYPTSEDFLFDLVTVLQEQDYLDKKWHGSHIFPELTPLPSGFSFAKMMDQLTEEGYLDKVKTEGKLFHKLKKHPWE